MIELKDTKLKKFISQLSITACCHNTFNCSYAKYPDYFIARAKSVIIKVSGFFNYAN